MSGTFGHTQVTEEQDAALARLEGFFAAVEAQIKILCPDGRRKSLALTKLEEASMWANKAVAKDAPPEQAKIDFGAGLEGLQACGVSSVLDTDFEAPAWVGTGGSCELVDGVCQNPEHYKPASGWTAKEPLSDAIESGTSGNGSLDFFGVPLVLIDPPTDEVREAAKVGTHFKLVPCGLPCGMTVSFYDLVNRKKGPPPPPGTVFGSLDDSQ
jgi:hypothetical protein